jgi:hypothetical protein
MSDSGDGVTPGGSPARPAGRSRQRSGAAAMLVTLAGVVGGAAIGTVPGIVARKTFLAPEPDAGLGDIGPALIALGMSALGAVVGAIVGYLPTTRRPGRTGTRTRSPGGARTRSPWVDIAGAVVLLLVGIPSAVVLYIIVPAIGVLVFFALGAVVISRLVSNSPELSSRFRKNRRGPN